jgi:hypothetical protein
LRRLILSPLSNRKDVTEILILLTYLRVGLLMKFVSLKPKKICSNQASQLPPHMSNHFNGNILLKIFFRIFKNKTKTRKNTFHSLEEENVNVCAFFSSPPKAPSVYSVAVLLIDEYENAEKWQSETTKTFLIK